MLSVSGFIASKSRPVLFDVLDCLYIVGVLLVISWMVTGELLIKRALELSF